MRTPSPGNGVGRRAMRTSLEKRHRLPNGLPVAYSAMGGEATRVDRPRIPWVGNVAPPADLVREKAVKAWRKALRAQERGNQLVLSPYARQKYSARQRMTKQIDG